jgi:hypothetical protein
LLIGGIRVDAGLLGARLGAIGAEAPGQRPGKRQERISLHAFAHNSNKPTAGSSSNTKIHLRLGGLLYCKATGSLDSVIQYTCDEFSVAGKKSFLHAKCLLSIVKSVFSLAKKTKIPLMQMETFTH